MADGDCARRARVREQVLGILMRILPGFDPAKHAPVESLRRALAPDSMDILNLVMALHDAFGVVVPERDYALLDTVEGCVDYVLAAMVQAASASPGGNDDEAPASAAGNDHEADDDVPVQEEVHRLRDGRVVKIRPLRAAADADRERRFLTDLSAESRYQRFHQWVTTPSEGLIHFLTDVDPQRVVALLCTVPADDAERVVGEARYVVDATGASCEFAVVIDDAWRRSGIAGLLLGALIASARHRGLRTMEGIVLASNSAMLRFARALGFEVIRQREDPTTVRVVKRL